MLFLLLACAAPVDCLTVEDADSTVVLSGSRCLDAGMVGGFMGTILEVTVDGDAAQVSRTWTEGDGAGNPDASAEFFAEIEGIAPGTADVVVIANDEESWRFTVQVP